MSDQKTSPTPQPKPNGLGRKAELPAVKNAENPEHHWVPVSDEIPWWMEIENLKRDRDKLIDAIRNLRDVKGRHHTQLAVDRLFQLLPEGHTK